MAGGTSAWREEQLTVERSGSPRTAKADEKAAEKGAEKVADKATEKASDAATAEKSA